MGPMVSRRVLLASPRSFCAGVDRAVEIVERLVRRGRDTPVFVRKQIVHNTHVVADLRARGATFDELDQIPDPPPEGAVVVFSAQDGSPAVRAEAARRGLEIVDTTCPLVSKVHAEARRRARTRSGSC
jgi:4-hydroxy-3-methylbut-2-en-1-yl diphosphate reductase